ncbi:MAG: DNA polymerase Y family protein [Planctomycetes bacterium]|nr:DNA polymerase Y family protein [Planctomycetota bacterium]
MFTPTSPPFHPIRKRALSVWLPSFATDLVWRRLRRAKSPASSESRPTILLTTPIASREIVAACCIRARHAGVRPGMDVAHARPLVSHHAAIHIEPHRPERDAESLERLAWWAQRFAPRISIDGADGLFIDSSGTEGVHGGELALVRMVGQDFARKGFTARVAAASTFTCAWAMARYGPHRGSHVPPGSERACLAHLPTAALNLDPSILTALRELGITQIHHLWNMKRSALASRFDPILLNRLDRLTGEAFDDIVPVRPRPDPQVHMPFDGPTEQWEPILIAAHTLLQQLIQKLITLDRGLRRLSLQFLLAREAPLTLTIDLSRPSQNAAHIWTLVKTRLESIRLHTGVEGLCLTATRTARPQRLQPALHNHPETHTPDSAAWGELIDTLSQRLGRDRVLTLHPVASHIPERTWREVPALESSPPSSPPSSGSHSSHHRPTALLPKPEPISVLAMVPDGPIASIEWRGTRHSILSSSAPERISPEWWRTQNHNQPPDRDYFSLQTTDGRWLWVCRQQLTNRWFVHGLWA